MISPKFLLTFLWLGVALGLHGQTAQILVEYEVTKPQVSHKVETDTYKMNLLAGNRGSKYFNPMSQYVDSLTSTPKGRETLEEIQNAAWVTRDADGVWIEDHTRGNAPEKKVFTYVVKDIAKGMLTVYDKYRDLAVYQEPLNGEMEWEIVPDSSRIVLGYNCLAATTTYHGRPWMAWFTPDIAVSDGPWKLHGLPGLILEAYPTDGSQFRFVATGLEVVSKPIPQMYQTDEYAKSDRRKVLADYDYYRNHYKEIFEAQHPNAVLSFQDENGNSTTKQPLFIRTTHALEIDY